MRTETWQSPVGLTHDAGWELALHRTLPASTEDVWRRLLAEWLPQWLGVESVPQMVGAPLRGQDRVRGRVIGCHVGRRVRVRWTPLALDHETVFQVTLQDPPDAAPGCTLIELHQERLLGAAERQALIEHWDAVLDALVQAYAREGDRPQDIPG
ncbi:hypothetical protein H3H54_15665 [Brachybacterium sp. Z12]|uniref:hypothetical protein n=1 Tax=Brachybacterium sp. Z12 TaxID=2759167 RepID=UPI001861C98D|nr:hypothetical protein [Brachybacterium sp. Z12]QNN82415.1 hypothetical protein H3H54_15665 [Brachybacterium sp. Z12]